MSPRASRDGFVVTSPRLTPAEAFAAPTPEAMIERQRSAMAQSMNRKLEREMQKQLHSEIANLSRSLNVALDLTTKLEATPIHPSKHARKKAAVPILTASDWHVEELVHAGHVNGVNEYNPTIARARSKKFVEGVLWLIETHRAGAIIEEAVLACIGDFITGWIHEELQSGNSMAPTEATLFAQELLHDVITAILKHSGLKRLRVICTRGNHGRITKKTYINAAARLSFEWMMYRSLAQWFKGDPRVEFVVEDGYHTYAPVFDQVLRFHHGDAVSYQGGVGGITIPLRKKIARWNLVRKATLDIMGHFHQLLYGGDFVVNGSAIGWNDYATWIGAAPEPPQQAFILIRPERGVSAFAPIFLQ